MMKTINIYKKIGGVLFTGLIMLSSCSDYLTTLPTNSLVSDGAISTPEDTKTALNGAYAGLISARTDDVTYYYYGMDFLARAEVGGDDTQTNKVGDRTENYYRFTYRQNNAPQDLWYPPYAVINRVNVLLDAIDKGEVPMNDVVKNSKGEALAIRALAHFNLLITYGAPYLKDNGASLGVPVVKTVLTATDLPSRSTVAEGYQAVLDDLSDALGLISEEKNYGHFNRWGVKALLARVNLYKGDYDDAYSYAKDVVENGPYSLIDNADYLTVWGQEENNESIFDLALSSTSYSGDRELWGAVVSPSEYGAVVATKAFVDLLNEDPDDVRLGLLVADKNGTERTINKYPGRGSVTINNVRVLRLSDIYLIGAEAALKKASPDQDLADEYLYQIRHRANPNVTKIHATLDLIAKERRKELVLEGHRLYDVLRQGAEITRQGGSHFLNGNDLITVKWSDYRTVMPIPQAEIDANPNILQNPEYN